MGVAAILQPRYRVRSPRVCERSPYNSLSSMVIVPINSHSLIYCCTSCNARQWAPSADRSLYKGARCPLSLDFFLVKSQHHSVRSPKPFGCRVELTGLSSKSNIPLHHHHEHCKPRSPVFFVRCPCCTDWTRPTVPTTAFVVPRRG